jgi:hypothetical protein
MANRYKCINELYFEINRRVFTKGKIYTDIGDEDDYPKFRDDEGDVFSFRFKNLDEFLIPIKFLYGK